MNLPFNEAKATQAAGLLLHLRGGTMNFMKLIKLLYLADREALLQWGRPITTDRWVSMDHGPVVSRVYSLISDEPHPDTDSVWRNHIQRTGYDVTLTEPVSDDELSNAEIKLLRQIFGLYGRSYRWHLVDYCHTLPEWKHPGGSSVPITIADILRGAGRSEQEVELITDEIDNLALVHRM